MRGRWEHAMEYAQPIKPLKPPEGQLSTSKTPRPTPASAQPLCAPVYCGGAGAENITVKYYCTLALSLSRSEQGIPQRSAAFFAPRAASS